ncbi:MAG: ceramide glucosyltransferase [Xanthobacteraceae bacterium]
MTAAILFAIAFVVLTIAIHLSSVAVAAMRCRAPRERTRAPYDAPAITLVRPVCGIDNYADATLGSSFGLDYPDYEIIFCVAQARDPVTPLLRQLIAANPQQRATLLIGDDRISENPKLNNCVKGWNAAAHDWIVLADSNVMMPPDYLARLMARWNDTSTGLVCSPPAGSQPRGFWASVECAILNTYQARWQYTADALGIGFAQGKTMLWRRDVLERAGGIRQLGRELAEDAASTKIVRAQGLRVRLTDAPFAQPLGHRSMADVWRRQARWAQLRRASFPFAFAPEIFSGALWPMVAMAFAAHGLGLSVGICIIALAAIWYGAEAVLAWRADWPLSVAYPLHAITRDLMLPGLWLSGWLASEFVWRGNPMRSVTSNEATQS